MNEYSRYISSEENGFKITKKIGDMSISVKYLPTSFLALKEAESANSISAYDSLLRIYEHSNTFLLSFQTQEGEKGEDIMYKGLENFQQYIERSMTLNFDLESRVKLNVNDKSYAPVLSSLENTYGLSKGRDVYMVFAAKGLSEDLSNTSAIDFVYQDDIYDIGILHFVFDKKRIDKNLPEVDIKKNRL